MFGLFGPRFGRGAGRLGLMWLLWRFMFRPRFGRFGPGFGRRFGGPWGGWM